MIFLLKGGFNDIGHPFHLHGFAFRVVAQNIFNAPTTMQAIRTLVEGTGVTRNFEGPLKDTVLVPGRGFTVIRFVADNPGTITSRKIYLKNHAWFLFWILGYWLFHCHISEHMAQGMALAFKVGMHSEMVKPPPNFPRCGNFF